MANMFRLLRADEIDARIGQLKNNGASLLLYKDARCDQNILDETVGPYNWQRKHDRDNANCTVSIWDKEKGQWISKEDVGTESKTEAEKGLASDSFKRACFNWGIGRELYTAPFIWVKGQPEDLKYEKFNVTEIDYDENREINRLVITNKAGDVIFSMGSTAKVNYKPKEKAPEPPKYDAKEAIKNFRVKHGMPTKDFVSYYDALVEMKVVPRVSSDVMTKEQCDALLAAIEKTFLQGEKAS